MIYIYNIYIYSIRCHIFHDVSCRLSLAIHTSTTTNQAKAADGKQLHQNAQGIVAGLDA
jgi:hypothetical protein